MSLFTKTPPDAPGWYWWRSEYGLCAINIRRSATGKLEWNVADRTHGYGSLEQIAPGEWGPQIYVPIAPPVECWGILWDNGDISIEGKKKPDLLLHKGWHVRGVFVPLAVEEPPTDAFARLAEASGDHWDGVDPDTYVRELRGEEPPQ